MENENNPEYSIIIDYDDFLSRFDLDEILHSIDKIIEDELLSEFEPNFRLLTKWNLPYWHQAPGLSYIGITGVDRGSISLTIIMSVAVATYVARRFQKGVDKSILAKQIERSGKITGDMLGRILERINDWAEKYVPEQRELGGKIKKIRVDEKRKNDSQL